MKVQYESLKEGNTDGIVVKNLSEGDLNSAAVCAELQSLWVKHGLIIFKGVLSTDYHLQLSKVFGDLERHTVKEILVDGFPDLIEVGYTPGSDAVYEVDGREVSAWIPWHTDLIYSDTLNHGGILRALTIPDAGGFTGFMDKIKLYESLPQALKEAIDDLHVVYKMRINVTNQKFATPTPVKRVRSSKMMDSLSAREDTDFPPVVHPLVFTQPETGRKLLNLSPMFAKYILEMQNEEGDQLLREITQYIFKEEFTYIHHWKMDDLVLWDNWRLFHCATGINPAVSRKMQRTTIKGDYAMGRKLSEVSSEIHA